MSTFTVELEGMQKLFDKLTAATKEDIAIRSLNLAGQNIAGWSKRNRLTGPRPQFLGVVTGRLRSSITAGETQHSGNEYIEKIGTNVQYAPIHEFGLRITKISSKGKAYSAQYPARPFLNPALEDEGNKKMVLDILTKNIRVALEAQ